MQPSGGEPPEPAGSCLDCNVDDPEKRPLREQTFSAGEAENLCVPCSPVPSNVSLMMQPPPVVPAPSRDVSVCPCVFAACGLVATCLWVTPCW